MEYKLVLREDFVDLSSKRMKEEQKKMEDDLEKIKASLSRMETAKAEVKEERKEVVKDIDGIIDLVQALDSGISMKKKDLAKRLKKIIKNDKSLKKIYKKYRDKKYLDEDLNEWKRGHLESLIERMASSKIDTASGIDMSIEMANRKKGKSSDDSDSKGSKDKYALGKHVAPRKRRKKEETEEEKTMRILEETHSQSKVIIKDIIKDADADYKEVCSVIDDLKKARTSNKYRDLSTLMSAKGSILGTKLQAAKEITNINKSIIDTSYKKTKDKKSKDLNDLSDAELFTDFFSNKLSGKIDKSGTKSSGGKSGKKKRSKSLEDAFEKKNLELNDYDEIIQFEGKWFTAIKSDYEEREWKFVAIDKDGNIIKKFPQKNLPKKKSVKLEFLDNEKARDKLSGAEYPVIKVKYM